MSNTTYAPERSAERLSVPESNEVKAYKKGLAEGKKGEKKGFITSLLDDLLKAIETSDAKRKEQLTAKTKTPTMETVVAAFDAANDVTAANAAAYRMRSSDEAKAVQMQNEARANFLALDPLVREGAILVLYVQAEAEYQQHQLNAAEAQRSRYDLAA